ncbi:MAG TPA: hypothetical protein VM734_30850 [Kofleriaceae bacterium]|nr:hypothetical protein [Kofleriaceae bacterium]
MREIGDGSVLALLTKDPLDALTVALDARLEAARVVLHPALMDLADLRVDQAGAADSASRLLRPGRAEARRPPMGAPVPVGGSKRAETPWPSNARASTSASSRRVRTSRVRCTR